MCTISDVNRLGMVSSRQRSSDRPLIGARESTQGIPGGGEANSTNKEVRVKESLGVSFGTVYQMIIIKMVVIITS